MENNRELGRALRDAGIRTAAEHADEVTPAWGERAFCMLVEYVAGPGRTAEFTGEAVRRWAEGRGLPLPPDKRAWGAVMSRAIRNGMIERAGITSSEDPISHRGLRTTWRRCDGGPRIASNTAAGYAACLLLTRLGYYWDDAEWVKAVRHG